MDAARTVTFPFATLIDTLCAKARAGGMCAG